VTQAQELNKQGKSEDAELLFQKALQAEPENATAHGELASLLSKKGRSIQALEHWRRAAQSGSTDYLVALARAQLQAYLENPSAEALLIQVKDSARKLSAMPAGQAENARIEGYLAVMENRNEDAIRHFRVSLAKNGKQEDVRLALLQQLLANNQAPQALELIAGATAKEALVDTYYLHTLATSGCKAAETFLMGQIGPASSLANTLKLAAHQRRCAGPTGEEAVLAKLRSNPSLNRTEAIVIGDYDAEQSNWPQALLMYEKAASLPEAPNAPSGSIEIRRSSALIGVGRFEEAAKILDAYLLQHPNDGNAKGQRGLLRLNASLSNANAAAGLQDLREALATPEAQTLPTLRLQLAMNLAKLGYLTSARQELQELSRIMPGALALSLLGAELDLKEGRPQLAAKTSRDILLQSPKLREARLILALSLSALGQSKEAISELRKLSAEYPSDESITVQLLAALAASPSSEDKQSTVYIINKLEAQSNLLPQTKFLLAEVLHRSGQADRATAIWQSLAEQSSDIRASLRLTELALAQGKGAEACPKLEALAKSEFSWPQTARAQWWALRGICAETRNTPEAAISAHRKALDLSPKDPVFANNLASALADQGKNLDEAKRLAELAVAAQSSNLQYLDTLGWVYYRQGDQDRARKIYQQLSARKPLPPNVAAHVSTVLGKP
jgi:tetratricopeptide (TPR) repeat protein